MATNKFYRKKNPDTGRDDFYEVNTDRYIGPKEFETGGYTEQKPDPRAEAKSVDQPYADARGGTGYLDSFKKNQNYLTILKDAIQRKMHRNKDIRGAKDYWRTKQMDPITFTDEKLRLLTPAQQRSLREQRYATAGAHMKGLEEEEAYRGGRLEDILSETRQLQEGEMSAREKDALAEGRRLDNLKKKTEFGYQVDPEDVYGSFADPDKKRVGFKQGGSISWRHNNPGNLKYASWQDEYGARKVPGTSFAWFPSEEQAKEAYKALLTSNRPGAIYKGLAPDEAMLKWSSDYKGDPRAYNYQKLVKLGAPAMSKDFNEFTDEEWNQFFEAQKQAEGWTEETYLQPEPEIEHEFYDEKEVKEIADALGLSAIEIWNDFTDAEIDELKESIEKGGGTLVDQIMKKIDSTNWKETGIVNKEILEVALRLRLEDKADNATMKAFGRSIGIELTQDNINALDNIQTISSI